MKEEYNFLKSGDTLQEGEIYIYLNRYICLIKCKKENNKYSYELSNYVDNILKAFKRSGVIDTPTDNSSYRYPTKQEIEHLYLCIKADEYKDYEKHIPSTDELNLLSLIEESKKLSNI